MPLNVYFYGPGYGESTILHWHGDGAEGCAVVDAFLSERGRGFTLDKLRELRVGKIDFLAATHPHLDHIKFIHRIVVEFRKPIDAIWWWGGLDRALYSEYFETLARADPAQDQHNRFLSVRTFLLEASQRRRNGQLPRFETSCNVSEILSQLVNNKPLVKVYAISPWADPLARFAKSLAEAHLDRRDLKTDINRASMGFIMNYGDAQILLGGDMESQNWSELGRNCDSLEKEWANKGKHFPKIKPTLIKVSHHGSRCSCLPWMWGTDGFLVPEGRPPIAVITPWHRGPKKGQLPNSKVIETIRRSGVRVFVTAASRTDPNNFRSNDIFPHLHLQLDMKGNIRVVERGESEEMAPLC